MERILAYALHLFAVCKMARASNDVSRIVCANIIQENKKRLLEARIKNQVLLHKVILPILNSRNRGSVSGAHRVPSDLFCLCYCRVFAYCIRILHIFINVI